MRDRTPTKQQPGLDEIDAHVPEHLAEMWNALSPADWVALVDGAHIELENDWDLSQEMLELRPRNFGFGAAEEMAEAFGIRYADGETLRAGEKEHARDARRWELDPASSEDYGTRARMLGQRRG